MRLAPAPAATLALAAACVPCAAGTVEVHPAGPSVPVIVGRLEPSERTLALDVAPDGARAAAVTGAGTIKQPRSLVRVAAEADVVPRTLDLAGNVLDLLFRPDGAVLYAIQQQPARKRRAPQSYLTLIDSGSLKFRREVYLPATASALAHWPSRDGILIAAENEIRSLLLPDLRSGPLFRLPGPNSSLAVLDDGRVLVGQRTRLVLLDLTDPPGHDEMPIRASADLPAPVTDLVAGGGGRALARLADGRVFQVETDPLRFEPVGVGLVCRAVSGSGPEAAPEERRAAVAERRAPDRTSRPQGEPPGEPARSERKTEDAARTTAEPRRSVPSHAVPDPVGEVPSGSVATPPEPDRLETAKPREPDHAPPEDAAAGARVTPAGAAGAAAERGASPPGSVPLPAPPVPDASAMPAERNETGSTSSGSAGVDPAAPVRGSRGEAREAIARGAAAVSLGGTIRGAGARAVIAVVVHGPDNILQEATRTAPAPDGRWEVHGLAPGRYRVTLDAGGGRVVVSEPRFHVAVIDGAATPPALDFEVLRSF